MLGVQNDGGQRHPNPPSVHSCHYVEGRSRMGDFGTLNVSVVALPDAGVATMFGIFDVLNAFTTMPIAGA